MTMTTEEMLSRLVAFDTISDRSNRALIDFIADYLDGFGITASIGEDESGAKADLIATIGPSVAGGIVLSGHTDVVPVAGQTWTSDPFELVARADKLYARGAADMKGFIAATLALVPEFLSRPLQRPLHLVFSYDEEVGCLGAPSLIARFLRDFPKAAAAIVGEPTGMRIANAHKGVAVYRTRITGKPGHSSNPGAGVNAIATAADCIRFLMAEAEAFKTTGRNDPRFDPPHATVSVGQISGGTAMNIIAGECEFVWDCRSVAAAEAADLEARFDDHCALDLVPAMRERAPGAKIATHRHCTVPPLTADPKNPAEALARQLTGQNDSVVSSFAAEAGMFQQAGIPAILCGPGEIAQAHQPDEFVTRDQLQQCEDFLGALGRWAADPR
ncbi:MAG: acetylornithine deacetylase [Rhodospirillales bacterium]|jgi:acetylornithine deacetylase|nr:acetylornithine deacetylase [Rhodospirillales bacterium]